MSDQKPVDLTVVHEVPVKDRLALARGRFLDIDKEPPSLSKLADLHDLNLAQLMSLSTREGWDSLRANALAARVVGLADLRMEVVRRVDTVLVKAAERIVKAAGEAYVNLIEEISAMPVDDPAPGVQGPASSGEVKPDKRKSRTPGLKPLLILKTHALNDATEGFSKFSLAMRDLGLVLIPDKVNMDDTKKGVQIAPGSLIQINQVLNQGYQGNNPPPPPPPPK